MEILEIIDIKAISTNVITYIVLGFLALIALFFRKQIYKLIKKTESNLQIKSSHEQTKITDEQKNNNISDEPKKPATLLSITELYGLPADYSENLQHPQACIAIVESVIEAELGTIGAKKLAEVLTGIAGGDFFKADEIFAEIETREKPAGQRGGRIAFARAKIAEHQLRWHDATGHYSYSACAYPCFETLIAAQSFCIKVNDYDSALAFSTNAKKVVSADYGEKSEQYAAILTNLASVYQSLEKHEKARAIYLQVLDICEYHLDKESFLISGAVKNLGLIYQMQDDYKNAESYFNQALSIEEKILGKNHPNTSEIITNLALLYSLQKLDGKAEKLFKKALNIRREALGENNPKTALCYNNLAGFYYTIGEHEQAGKLFKKAIKILENTLGPEDPTTKQIKQIYEKSKKQKPTP